MPIQPFHLQNNEQVVLVLHRHWFVLARELAAIVFTLVVGAAIFFLKSSLYQSANTATINPLVTFFFSLYILLILALAFAIWINYRLDVWIITTQRIIDVEQRGLFNREISEFLISNVQDITTEVPNIIMTFLDFGNMTIQTAGHKNFVVREIPRLEEAKKIILEYSHKAHQEESMRS